MSYNLEEVEFTREMPEAMKPRAAWMINAIKFMRIRGWLSSNWVKCTSGVLEGGKMRTPKPLPGSTKLEDLHLSENLKDVYHAANDVKPRFDKFVANLMKKSFPKAKTYVCDSWGDWQARVDKAAEAKRTAVVASSAKLDAVDAAAVIVPLKDRDRALKKSKEAYGGHVNHVTDIVRASIVCNSDEDVAALMHTLTKCTEKYHALGSHNPYDKTRDSSADGRRPGTADSNDSAGSTSSKGFSVKGNIAEGMRVIKVKNRFKLSAFNGYRDILITIAADHVEDHSEDVDPRNKKSRQNLKAVPENRGGVDSSKDEKKQLGQVICELQVHHLSMLQTSMELDSYGYYSFFRAFFQPEWEHSDKTPDALAAAAEKNARDFSNKLKVLKTMDQVGEFVEALEGAMQVYLGGVGRVGKDLPRLSAYFSLFSRVNEVALAEAMQSSIIRQLREQHRLNELFKELSRLSRYFQGLKRYQHALPLSEEALSICTELHGDSNIETAHQLTNHANLLYCCGDLEEAVPLFKKALDIKRAVAGRLHPLTYDALNNLGELYDDTGQYKEAYDTYLEVLSVHREIARNSRTGQAGPEVAEALVHLAQIEEITAWQEEDGEDKANKDKYVPPPPPKVGEEVIDPKVLKEREEMAKRKREEKRKGLFKKALKLYDEAIQIYRDFYGPVHERCASVYDAIANLRDQQGMMGAAIDNLRKALDVRERAHQDTCEYMGAAPDDFKKAPPHPNFCENYTRLGELLLDVGDVRAAKPYLITGVHHCEIIALNENNHKLCYGKENAMMALASAQTALADCYLRLGGPHNYEKCRPLLHKAYSVRLKYVGVRAHATAHTMNIQGMLDELEADWKEEIEQVAKDQKKEEEEERKKKTKRAADYDMVEKVDKMAGTKTKVGIVGTVRDEQMWLKSEEGKSGKGTGTGTNLGSIEEKEGSVNPSDSPDKAKSLWKGTKGRMEAALAFSSSGSSSGSGSETKGRSGRPGANRKAEEQRQKQQQQEEDEAKPKELTEEEQDQLRKEHLLRTHVHTKSTRDTLARQQVHARVKRCAELVESVEHFREIGETGEAMKVAAQAVAWLLPIQRKMDTEALPEGSKWRQREVSKAFKGGNEGEGEEGEEGSLASQSAASRKEEEERNDAAASLSVFTKGKEGKGVVNVDTGGPDAKLAMAVVLSQLGCVEEDRGYYLSATDYFFQALQLVCLVYYPTSHHLYSTLESIESAMLKATEVTQEIEECVKAALNKEEAAEHAQRMTEAPPAPKEGAYHHDPHEHHSHYGHPLGEAGTHTFCHDDVALCLANLAGSLRFTEQHELSCGYAMAARDMLMKLRKGDETDRDVTRMDHILALNAYALGRHQLAFYYIDRALRNRKACYKTQIHPDYVASLNVKAVVEAALGHPELSEETAAECMKVRGKIYGTSDPSYALGTNSWAVSMFVLDDLAHSGRVFTESFESRERQLGSGSSAVLACLQNMAALFIRQNDYTNADPFIKGAEQVGAFLQLQYGPVYTDEYRDTLLQRKLPKPKIKKRRHNTIDGHSRPGSRDSFTGSRPGSRGGGGGGGGPGSRPGSRDSISGRPGTGSRPTSRHCHTSVSPSARAGTGEAVGVGSGAGKKTKAKKVPKK